MTKEELGAMLADMASHIMQECNIEDRRGKSVPVKKCCYLHGVCKGDPYHVIAYRLSAMDDQKPVQITLALHQGNLYSEHVYTGRENRIPEMVANDEHVYLNLSYSFELGGGPMQPRQQANSRRFLYHVLKEATSSFALKAEEFNGHSHITRFIVAYDIDLKTRNKSVSEEVMKQCVEAVKHMIVLLKDAVSQYENALEPDEEIIDSISRVFTHEVKNPISEDLLMEYAKKVYSELMHKNYEGAHRFKALYLSLPDTDNFCVGMFMDGLREYLLRRVHSRLK